LKLRNLKLQRTNTVQVKFLQMIRKGK